MSRCRYCTKRRKRQSFCSSLRRLRTWCFFFASRRRHTRFDCDWSSDVCSSDLKRRVSITKLDPQAVDSIVEEMSDAAGLSWVEVADRERLVGTFTSQGPGRDVNLQIGRALCRVRV